MPTYLCHGFRWHRKNIRPFVILNNLDDAAPDWVIGRATSTVILKQLYRLYDFIPPGPGDDDALGAPAPLTPPSHANGKDAITLPPPRVHPANDKVLMHHWSAVKLLEEYDPEEMREPSRPYAFVAHAVARVDLHLDLAEAMAKYRTIFMQKDTNWFGMLRDELQKDEPITWYVVVCGEENRSQGDMASIGDGDGDGNGELEEDTGKAQSSSPRKSVARKKSKGEGLRRLFHRKGAEEPPLPTNGESHDG